MASARMKLPMNRNMIGEAKAESASLGFAMPRGMQSDGASRAVAAMGMASVTHQMMARASTAARRWHSCEMPGIGNISISSMARTKPIVGDRKIATMVLIVPSLSTAPNPAWVIPAPSRPPISA